jgi:hypothetical protein
LKVLKYIVNIVVWTLLGLYLLFILTFKIPAVQQWLGGKLAVVVAEKLGTSVAIGRADVGIPNRLTLYDVVIRDQQDKDMLTARRLSATIDLLPLADGKISIATGQIFGAHGVFYQRDSLSKPNFQFALDSLASKDTTSTTPLDLRFNSLIMRHSSVTYDRLDLPETPDVLNPNHLKISDINLHAIVKTLTEDSLNINLKRLALKEKSGLQIDRLAFRYQGGRNGSYLEDFELKMPGTDVKLGDIEAKYRFRGNHFVVPSLVHKGSIEESTITLSDLACLLPTLKTFNSTLTLSADFRGQGEDIHVSDLLVNSTTGDIDIDIDGWVRNLSLAEPTWLADINDLRLSDKTINFISENLKGQQMNVPPIVTRLGNIHMKGFVKGTGISEVTTNSQLATDAGNVALSLMLNRQREFSGSINTSGINLRQLLDNEHFGMLATKININGKLPSKGDVTIEAEGDIDQFDYNGYQFQHIAVNGLYSPDDIHGMLNIDDPNLQLSVEGLLKRTGKTENVQVEAHIDQFSPQAIHLSDQWGDARFAANLKADFTASGTNDAMGSIDLTDLTMESEKTHYQMDGLHVESGYADNVHYITLNSDFATGSIRGDFDYSTLLQSITNFVVTKLPTLPGLPQVNPHTHNNFVVDLTIHKSDWLQQLLQVPVTLTSPLTLNGTVNDPLQQIVLTCNAPQLFYNDSRYDDCNVSIVSPMNTLLCDVSATKLMGNGEKWDLQVTTSAYNNQLTASLLWDNHAPKAMNGMITAMFEFNSTLEGKAITNVDIASSKMTIDGASWDVLPSRIAYYDNRLDIFNFAIRHDQQHLMIDGTASESNLDSLQFNLNEIDISYVLNLINFHAVAFDGLATGSGTISGVLGDLQANGALKVDQFKFEHGRMGTLDAHVNWNAAAKQIDIHAIADDGPEARTLIDGYVSPERNYIDLDIRAKGTYLDFARSFTSSFCSDVSGHANGAVRLIGPLDAINLTGELVLNGNAHVTALGCTYELRNDTIRMVPNEMEFVRCEVFDIYGNKGLLTGGIHHQELTNLTFDIYVDADNLLAYDFPDFGDDTFYGTVFARGNAAIHGRENETIIEADITPQKNSFFVYNASSPEVVSSQEFIQWETHPNPLPRREGREYPLDGDDADKHITPLPDRDGSGMGLFQSDLTMRLKVNTTPDAQLRLLMDARTGDYIVLRGRGDLQATYYNKGGFNMFGNYEVTEGKYNITIQNVIKKDFTFSEGGTIVFGGDPYDATLNLQAQHIVNGVSLSDLNVGQTFSNTVRVNCLMNITGQPKAPVIDFDFDILNVNSSEKQMVRNIITGQDEMRQQVIYLLAIGRFYPQGANNAAENESQRNSTSLAMQSLLSGTLSGQLNSMLGQVIKSNNWNFGANISTGDEGWNNAEYEGIINGRLLNNRLLINGQFGYRDNATTANPSFIGDFDIRYLLYPSGNLALKVYNQTNDRYFTRSALNTQGIGIIMKKDFNGLRSLFQRKRKPDNK